MSKFELPKSECPQKCENCKFFEKGYFYNDTCTANGCKTPTHGFSRPDDRPSPIPLNCPWWRLSLDKKQQDKYLEERLCELTFWRARGLGMYEDFESRRKLCEHIHRAGGCGIIDFNLFPDLLPIYKSVIQDDNAE